MSSSPSRYQREIRLHTRHIVELRGEGLADAAATMSPEQFPCACVREMDHGGEHTMQQYISLQPISNPTPVPVSINLTRLMQASIAPNTAKAYGTALGKLAEHLNGQSPTDAVLADYLARLHARGLAPASVALVVQAVRFWEKLEGRLSSVGPLTTRTLAGIRREGRDRGRGQVTGLTRETVKRMAHNAAKTDTLAGLRNAALLRVMSDALLRIGEAVAIDCEHITTDDASGRLAIHRSKTDQEGKGVSLYLTVHTVEAIRQLQARAGYTTGPLFRRMLKGDHMSNDRLTVDGARLAIKASAKQIGIEGVSGHSLRIGTAQELVQRGASLVELQNAGRWTDSQMPAHYTRKQTAGKGAVARLLGDD
ncbi:MAG: tyrosine-type recombinase/integrase [Gemmatimonadetes bacterium]|nr:tyrosine-type recombinase/integrase [Gemmatimonadota bacterium]